MERPLSLVVLTFVVSFIAAALGSAQNGPRTIGVDEIRPGMRGYGMTVFRGTQPERFDVEVIDVLHNFRPDQHLILVKTIHPVLDHALVVGGMSGSPIYLDDRLAGAYAYGWPFGRDPVVGVTPIANMLSEMRRPVRPDSFPGARVLAKRPARRTARNARRRASLAGLPAFRGGDSDAPRHDAFTTLRAHAARVGIDHADATRIRPAATPVMLGGFTDEIAELMREELAPFGLTPMQAGGGTSGGSQTGPGYTSFVDGGAIAVQLIRGDISATGVGTVTHVGTGNRVIAFGHPMMNAGELGLPTATANVLHILASIARSLKLAEALNPVGALIHDRQSAIVMDTALTPATIPMRIKLNGIEGAMRDEWNVELASHRFLSPMLAFGAMANAIKATSSDQTDVIFAARTTVGIDGHADVSLEDRGYMGAGPGDLRSLARLRMFRAMEAAFGNPFVESRVTSLDIELDVQFSRDVLVMVDAQVASAEVDPGATVNVFVTLRSFGHDDVVRVVPVRIPTHAAGRMVEVGFAAGDAVRIEQGRARSLDDLIDAIEEAYPATSLVASLKMPSRGLRFDGHVVRSLPPSALNTLQLVNGGGPGRPFNTYERQEVPLGQVVVGGATVRLRVRDTPRDR